MFGNHRVQRHLVIHWRPWVLAVASYLPLIALQRGRINADTKLYLGEDPAGLIARSLFAWDSSQFGGFVPHQAIAYLWPSGPFYWFFDLIGSPQWFTQRIWVGSIFLAAALGAYVFLRHLLLSLNASFIGALFFMSSPYVLAYQSRTSSMLLAWAGVSWLCYFTARGMRSRSWLWPSLIALTMFTVGSVNATATLLILPAPVVIAVMGYTRDTSLKTFMSFSLKTVALTTGVSLWWIVMLNIQATYGAKLLSYSETLESVASTPHAFEVLRGFGYWLNYVGLDTLPLTTGALRVFTSTTAMAAGVLLVIIAIASLALCRHRQGRVGLWLVLVGVVLSVGVYPLGDSFPIFGSLADNPTSTLSLAFRSSTRAIPVVLLGLAIGIAIICDQVSLSLVHTRVTRLLNVVRIQPRHIRVIVPFCVVALVGLAHPTRYTSGSFEPTLERTVIPETWHNFANTIDNSSGPDSRVVQLPGQEFGAYNWGYTVDPAWPAVSTTPLLTRDLIPLGNETMMNTLWATDEAFREGRLHPNALGTLARVLSTRTFFFPSDLDNERYDTPNQDAAIAANSFTNVQERDSHRYISYGVETGSIIRQQFSSMLLLGDGKGLVDAAVAGVVGNDSIIYAGHLTNDELSQHMSRISHVVVTDTHTEKAQHWRSSIDTLGFDENREGDLVNFGRDSGDIRMRIFSTTRNDDITWFEQVGPMRVRASSYGPPLSYRPEHRPFSAIDNNRTTSWEVAHGVTALAPVIQLLSQEPVSELRLTQPQHDINRRISQISISVDDQPWEKFSLHEASITHHETISLPISGNVITIRIDATVPTRPLRPNEELSGVGFAEISTGSQAAQEVGVLPTRGLENLATTTPLSYVLTRRVAPIARDTRSDIESNFVRSFYVPNTQQMNVTLRFDISDKQPTEVNELVRNISSESPLRINGKPMSVTQVSPPSDGSLTATLGQVPFTSGAQLLETTTTQYPVDQIVISNTSQRNTPAIVTPDITSSQLTRKSALLQPCPNGCWLVLGEGHSTGWRAELNGKDLGEPQIVDGGSNGWWIEPTTRSENITIAFTPQNTLNAALIVSALFVILACLGAVLSRRSRNEEQVHNDLPSSMSPIWSQVIAVSTNAVVMLALLDVRTAMWTTALMGLVVWTHFHKDVLRLTAALFTLAMTATWWESVTTTVPMDFGWPTSTQGSHHTLLACLVVLACLSLLQDNPATAKNASIH